MKFLIIATLVASTLADNSSIESIEEEEVDLRYSQCAKMPYFMKHKIVGGATAPEPIPWQVSIRSGGSHFCGGTILDERTILSAGHCFDAKTEKRSYSILAGTVDRQSGAGQVSDISAVVWNKEHQFQGINNDIVILKLSQSLKFNNNVRPACLPSSSYSYSNNQCFVSGWGTLSSGGHLPKKLQYVDSPPISQSKCRGAYGSTITDAMFCAGYMEGGKDSCQGDSGGPYVCNENGVATVTGIVSFGRGCASANYPGVYTRVPKFVSWIRSQMEGKYVKDLEAENRTPDMVANLFGTKPRYPYVFEKYINEQEAEFTNGPWPIMTPYPLMPYRPYPMIPAFPFVPPPPFRRQ